MHCVEKKIHYGIADAMVVWICNYAYTDPYPSEDKVRVGKKKRKSGK